MGRPVSNTNVNIQQIVLGATTSHKNLFKHLGRSALKGEMKNGKGNN
jgi:hypothetical protein